MDRYNAANGRQGVTEESAVGYEPLDAPEPGIEAGYDDAASADAEYSEAASPEDYFAGSQVQGMLSRETFDEFVQELMSEDPEFASLVETSPDPQQLLELTYQEVLSQP